MCYFMFAITNKAIDSELINKLQSANLYVRECTCCLSDAIEGLFYYEINNGHCACDISVSPYDKVDEIKELIESVNKKGDYRFFILDSEYDDEYLEFEENKTLEKNLKALETLEVIGERFLSLYPKEIRFDILYNIKN